MRVKVEGNIKSDIVKMQGVVFCSLFNTMCFLLVNFITFWHQCLLSLTQNDPSRLKLKCYENSELKLIRGEMNWNPQLNRLPFEVICKVRDLKIHKKRKEG